MSDRERQNLDSIRLVARAATTPVPLDAEEENLLADIAAAIDRRLLSLGCKGARGPEHNVSFVIDCRKRVVERKWNRPRQRRVSAALERRYLDDGWKHASIYVMEDNHLRLRVTLRSHPPTRQLGVLSREAPREYRGSIGATHSRPGRG